jgi:hypothetical protein
LRGSFTFDNFGLVFSIQKIPSINQQLNFSIQSAVIY